MAAADRIEILSTARGGHGAHPHVAVDPVLVAGHVITAVQSIVSRNVSPLDTAVMSLCAMQAGNPGAMSVIPSHAQLVGTVRTFRPATQDMIERRLRELVAVDRRCFRCARRAEVRARLPGRRSTTTAEARFVGRRRRIAGRRRQRRAQPRAVDGRGGLLVHAAGEAGRIRAARAGRRRRRQLPAQQPLRLQRQRDSARRGICSRRWRSARCPSTADLAHCWISRTAFAADYAEAREKFLAAAELRSYRSSSHVHPTARGVPKARSCAADVARWAIRRSRTMLLLTSGDARRRGLLRIGLPGCTAARRHDACDARRQRRRRRAVPRRQSLRLLAPAPHQRGQRRPQSQLPRLQPADRAQHGYARCTRSSSPTNGRHPRQAEALGRHAAARLDGLQAASPAANANSPMACSTAGRAPAWSNTAAARRVLRAAAQIAARSAGSTSTPASARADTARRSIPDPTTPRRRTRQDAGRAGRHVVPRRDLDVRRADRRRIAGGARSVPRRDVRRHRARIRHAAVERRRCRRCAPTNGSPIIRPRR